MFHDLANPQVCYRWPAPKPSVLVTTESGGASPDPARGRKRHSGWESKAAWVAAKRDTPAGQNERTRQNVRERSGVGDNEKLLGFLTLRSVSLFLVGLLPSLLERPAAASRPTAEGACRRDAHQRLPQSVRE